MDVENESSNSAAKMIHQADLLQDLINIVPMPQYFRNTDGFCIWCNKAFEKFVGSQKEWLVGKKIDEVLFADSRDSTAILDDMLISLGGEQNFESSIRSVDGNMMFSVAVYRTLYQDPSTGKQGILTSLVDMTHRKQVEQSANKALGILNGVLESAYGGLIAIQWVNGEPIVVSSNNNLTKMFGLADAVGQEKRLITCLTQKVVEPANYEEIFLSQASGGRQVIHEEIRLHNGKLFAVYSNIFCQGDEVAGRIWNYRDITEERLIQSRLKESNERNQALWYQSSDCIFVFDPDTLGMLEVNEKCLKSLEYNSEEFLSRKLTDIIVVDIDMARNSIREVLSAGQRFLGPRLLRTRKGTFVHVEASSAMITYRSSKAILVTARNISDRVRLEDQILADVHLAANVQRHFLPEPLMNPYVHVEGIYSPHYSISGDIYSYTWNPKTNCLSGFLLDVSGHGIATSLITSILLPLAKESMEKNLPLHERVSWLNHQSQEWFRDGSYAVGIFFELDVALQSMMYVPAGIGRFIHSGTHGCRLMKSPGFMLGLWPQAVYETQILSFQSGDAVFFVTDGISDLLHGDKLQFFPEKSFPEQVQYLRTLACDAIREDDASGVCIHLGNETIVKENAEWIE